MTPRAVLIVCARAPRRLPCVPATLIEPATDAIRNDLGRMPAQVGAGSVNLGARCSWCGQRVKVVA